MPRARNRKKSIAVIEAFWDSNIEQPLSVRPVMDLAKALWLIRAVHLTCNTLAELRYALKLLGGRRYDVLYFACHGTPGTLVLGEDAVDLDTLAALMKTRFRDTIVHFGSCGTLRISRKQLNEFMLGTQVAMVIGYREDPYWVESAALELLLLEALQRYKDLKAMWRYLKSNYGPLMRRTGLVAFFRP